MAAWPRSRSNNARNGGGPSRCRACRKALEDGSTKPNPASPAVNCQGLFKFRGCPDYW